MYRNFIKKLRKGMLLLLIISTIFILSACQKEDVAVFLIQDSGMEITHLTTGIIKADTVIAVRFREEQVKDEFLGKELSADVFKFTPEIKGKVYWDDTRTLVYEPATPLYQKMNYHGILNLAEISPEIEEGEVDKLEFHFQTLGQQLLGLEGEFVLFKDNDPENVYFQGNIELSERVSKEKLRETLKLELEGDNLSYELETKDNLNYNIKSDRIKRYRLQDRELNILLEGGAVGLSENVEDRYLLTAIEAPLNVLRIEEEKTGEFSQIRIVFSDKLQENRDYQGYLNISPQLDYQVSVENNSLLISGQFRAREKYNIELFPGIESIFGQRLAEKEDYMLDVEIADWNPVVEFVNPGFLLTSAKEKKINFRTMNVERLRLQVKKVKEENLLSFYEENTYRPYTYSFDEYNRYQFKEYGEIIEDRILEIGSEENKWIQSELDLADVITEDDSALYIVQLDFDENQVLYISEDLSGWYRSDYLLGHGRAVKHLLLSDIGITVKNIAGKYHVFLSDLLSTEALANAIVELKDKGGEVLDTAYSNEMGLALLETESTAKYIEVKSGNKYGIMNLDSSVLNNSIFDIGGIQLQDGVNAFIYTERGVYRPGDEINISAIVRNEDDSFPDKHPVGLRLYNPQGKLASEKLITEAEDGFYSFNFTTEKDALTGNWKAVLEIGNREFTQQIRIEEVVPYRIRVNIDSEKEILRKEDSLIDFSISSEYLFGAAASGLDSETVLAVEPYNIGFSNYNNFVFTNDSSVFKKLESNTFKEKLNEEGKIDLSWDIPELNNVPSALRLKIDTKVYESGGRSVPRSMLIPIEHYDNYVGIMELESPERSIGDEVNFNIVHLTKEGEPIADKELDYSIYRLRRYWWWEFSNQDNFRRHYKSNERTELVEEGKIQTNQEGFASLNHKLNDYGEILLEVRDPEGGHQAGYFFRSYWWGDSGKETSADVVNLKLDKKEYLPGETAEITLNTPAEGKALITVEKGEEILYKSWEEIKSSESVFEIQVKEEYIPNAYISVIVFQPYGEIDNDLPIRMYGIIPLHVISEGTNIDFELDLPEEIRPEEELRVKIQTKNKEKARFTIAVVDEGLLDITGFKTPAPWEYFFSKQRLLTRTYDNFSDIIDLSQGYIYNRFSVGGGRSAEEQELTYQQRQAQSQDADRFEAVSLFKGPLETDEKGYAELSFEIPNYIGSLRVMVVAADKGNYGSAEDTVAVKSPLMVLPTLPRVLGPLDKIRIPVSIFALEENLGKVRVSIETDGPARIIGNSEKDIEFTESGTKEVFFELEAENMIGKIDISISAFAEKSDYLSTDTVEMPLRPYNPYIYSTDEKIVESGQQDEFLVPEAGIGGTGSAQLAVSSMKGLNINHRLKWLLRYPYGCIEQTTSTVFPQLFLPEVYKFDYEELLKIDERINAGISRMREFQLNDGGFSYWPNGSYVNQWATNYVGHFLLEAGKKGYHIPEELINKWIEYQVQTARGNEGDLLSRTYRLYLLALADSPVISSMNYMRESELEEMRNTEKFMLAAAYYVSGYEDIAEEIISGADIEVEDYFEFSGTFGSTLRDKAIILDVLTLMGDYDRALLLYNDIAEEMSSENWYSTQTTAYSLLALSKYITGISEKTDNIKAQVILADMSTIDLKVEDPVGIVPIEANFADNIIFQNQSDIPLYVSLEWEGIPERGNIEAEESELTLRKNYFDQDGNIIEIDQIKQGESFYILFQVGQKGNYDISEVALVQVLPAGWEIENLRLLGGQLPDWTNNYNLDQEEYLDIRDDRIMWFFDMEGYVHSYDFIVKINPVTVGEFYLPPTLVEAMYNNKYKVTTEGRKVEVLSR